MRSEFEFDFGTQRRPRDITHFYVDLFLNSNFSSIAIIEASKPRRRVVMLDNDCKLAERKKKVGRGESENGAKRGLEKAKKSCFSEGPLDCMPVGNMHIDFDQITTSKPTFNGWSA